MQLALAVRAQPENFAATNTVVQSLAVLAMPWTVLLAERVHGHRVSSAMWRAVALTVAGTAWFERCYTELDPDTEIFWHFKEGDSVPVTLVFEGKDGRKESVELKAPVKALNAAATPHKH